MGPKYLMPHPRYQDGRPGVQDLSTRFLFSATHKTCDAEVYRSPQNLEQSGWLDW
jgi:hypothetical protein